MISGRRTQVALSLQVHTLQSRAILKYLLVSSSHKLVVAEERNSSIGEASEHIGRRIASIYLAGSYHLRLSQAN